MMAAAGVPHLVFDTTCLSHFARADRLDVLGDLLAGTESFIPHVVREEIRDGSYEYPDLTQILNVEWLRVVALDTLDRLRRFTVWTSRVGAGTRDLGEASVLAVAEELGAVALIDERDATRIGRAHGVNVHGKIWLLATTCRDGKLAEVAASNLVDTLAATGPGRHRAALASAELPVSPGQHHTRPYRDAVAWGRSGRVDPYRGLVAVRWWPLVNLTPSVPGQLCGVPGPGAALSVRSGGVTWTSARSKPRSVRSDSPGRPPTAWPRP